MLGIDVSKETLVCTLVDPQTRQPRWEKTVPNTALGVAQLLAKTPAATAWVVEPTGNYSVSVAKQAQAAGRTVLLAPSKAAQLYLKSLNSRAKTDRIDSQGLALFALDRALRPYPLQAAAAEPMDQLLAARQGIAEALSRLKQRLKELPHAAGPLQEAVDGLVKQQHELERQIKTLTQQETALAPTQELQRVPGIGLITAATAASRLATHSFAHPDQWIASLGLDIGVRQSGKRKGEWGLTKQGDAELRRLFYLCAQSTAPRANSPFAAQYQRELKKGLKKTAALCAVARKMARLVWSLFVHGTSYDPARIYQAQPA